MPVAPLHRQPIHVKKFAFIKVRVNYKQVFLKVAYMPDASSHKHAPANIDTRTNTYTERTSKNNTDHIDI